MNGEDPFEERIRGIPPRPMPSKWRHEILSQARAVAHSQTPAISPVSWFPRRVRELLWPHPVAWAGLAASWMLVIGLNFAAHETPPPALAQSSGRPSPQEREVLHQQEQLLAELVGPLGSGDHSRRRSPVPRPRSEYRETIVNS